MVRPYAVKGRKRKKREENYDKEEEVGDDQFIEVDTKAATDDTQELGDGKSEEEVGLPGIPVMEPFDQNNKNGVIFILEKASLEVGKVGKSYQILNSDEHSNFLRRNNKNPADYRPDIVHQALLTILDSPLNKARRLRAVYVRTEKGVLFEVKPYVRIPRTFKRFAGIMLQLLQKFSITSDGKRDKLMRVIKNPVTQYLPINSHKIGLSYSSEKSIKMSDYVADISNDVNLVFVVGAMAHGRIDKDYTDNYVSRLSGEGPSAKLAYRFYILLSWDVHKKYPYAPIRVVQDELKGVGNNV